MNVFFYLILVLVATYPKVSEIKLMRKYIGQGTAEKGVETSNTYFLSNIPETFSKNLRNVKNVCWRDALANFGVRTYQSPSSVPGNRPRIAISNARRAPEFSAITKSSVALVCARRERTTITAMNRRLSPQSDVSIFRSSDNMEPEPFVDDVGPSDQSHLIDPQKEPSEQKPPPPDRYHLFYVISYLLGMSTLLPWYFFITCTEYWMYRFRDLSNGTVTSSHAILLPEGLDNRDQLQADFMSYVSIASTIPSTLFLFANLFFLKRFSINGRVVLAFSMLLMLFIETTVLILFDTDKWQWYFFVVTLATVVLLNISTGLLQAALCAIITSFPVRYIAAFSSGQSIAGILAAVIRIWSLYVGVDRTRSTFMYFSLADVIILTAFCCYFGAGKLIMYPCAALFLCFVVTTCVYPSIAVLVVSSNYPIVCFLGEYFVPVVTYLLYSVCEYSGRVLAGLIQKPKGKYAFWFSVGRIILVPLLMLCNTQPRFHLHVLFKSDLIYAALVIVLALSNGYLANLSFVLMHKSVYHNEHEPASSILVIWLALGLSVGSVMSFPLVNML